MKHSFYLLMLLDLVSYIYTFLPAILPWIIYYYVFFIFLPWHPLALIMIPLFIPLVFICICFCLRLTLPKLKSGVYDNSVNAQFVSWFLNLALGRAIRVGQLQELILCSYNLKYLYWNAMGAKVAFNVNNSMYINLVDLPLIEIGAGTTLGDRTQIVCHLLTDKKLVLNRVKIDENCFIGADCKILVGSQIGRNSFIGYHNILNRKIIPENSNVAAYTYEKVK